VPEADYVYQTTPYAHQHEAFMLSRDLKTFALLAEMGCGKTKIIIDNAAYLYERGIIDALLVIAPNGVHRNWVVNELPVHLPTRIPHRAMFWSASPTREQTQQRRKLLQSPDLQALSVVAMNVEAFSRKGKALEFANAFLAANRCMLVVDESTTIKNMGYRNGRGVKRTGNIMAMAELAPYRRIMTGTPVSNSPLDLFPQFYFLSPKILGFTSFTAFRARYAELLKEGNPLLRHIQAKARRPGFVQVVARDKEGRPQYKNLEELRRKIAPHSFQITKAECLDLPPKIYEQRYVALSPEQERLYEELSARLRADLREGGEITAAMAITRLMRLQQVLGGFVTPDGARAPLALPGGNPRLEALLQVLEEAPGKVIIWARFRAELQAIANALEGAVEYHGGVAQDDRQEAVRAFQEDEAVRYFVAQPHSGGYGLTLTAATTVVYYSNDFSLEVRLQSEDRCHRIGQHSPVTYVDLVAPGTVDEKIREALRMKKDVAAIVSGKNLGEWI